MIVNYPNISKMVGFDCHNNEPYYLLNEIPFSIKVDRLLLDFKIPIDFTSDGCTLKFKILWLLLGCPHTSKFLPASLIHDYFTKNKFLINRELATDVFIYVLIAEGVNSYKAHIMGFFMNLYQKYYNRWE